MGSGTAIPGGTVDAAHAADVGRLYTKGLTLPLSAAA